MEWNRATANAIWSAISLLLRYETLGYRSHFWESGARHGSGVFLGAQQNLTGELIGVPSRGATSSVYDGLSGFLWVGLVAFGKVVYTLASSHIRLTTATFDSGIT